MPFEVFIDGCEPGKEDTLAGAVADRYRIPPAQIVQRLGRGRFRVKANVDRAAADALVTFLERAGAQCSIVDEGGDSVYQTAEPAELDVDESFPVLHTPPPGDMPYESGLAAAFAGGGEQDLGALGGDGMGFSLGTLDGHSDDGPAVESLTASAATKPAPAAEVQHATSDNDSAFLPPEMVNEANFSLEVDREEPAVSREPTGTFVSEEAPEPPTSSVASVEQGTALPATALTPRARIVIAVATAFVIGGGVAHVVASSREQARYGPVIKELREEYAAANTLERWKNLDEARHAAEVTIKERRSGVAVTAGFVWLIVAGLIGFALLRFLPGA